MKKLIQLFILCLFTSTLHAAIETQWISNIVVPGEETSIIFIFPDGQRAEPAALPVMKGASARFTQGGFLPYDASPTRSAFCLVLSIITDTPGEKTLPPLTFKMENGDIQESPKCPYTVLPFTSIKWLSTSEPGKPQIPYGILWHTSNPKPYVDEPIDVTLKVYAPAEVQNFQIPNVKAEGLAVNRFETRGIDENNRPTGSAFIKDKNWNVISFQSQLTPLRDGPVSVSGEITFYMISTLSNDPLGQMLRNIITIPANLPKLELDAQQLPSPAPAGFKNAVGQFSIQAQTDARDLSSSDSVSVRIIVQGTGNLAQLECPNIQNAKVWKLYPPNKIKSTNDDSIVFQQLIRPTSEVQEIPPFTLTYFDPQLKKYQTVSSAPIPLPWKTVPTYIPANEPTNNTPPPAGDVPVEKMVDILATPPNNILNDYLLVNPLWFFLAYIPVCAILGWIGLIIARKRREKSAITRERDSELRKACKPNDRVEFLRGLGAFIEANIPPAQRSEDITNILQTRDDIAFRPDAESNKISSSERKQMMKNVRHILGKLMAFALIGYALISETSNAMPQLTPEAQKEQIAHAEQSYISGQYSEAAKTYRKIVQEFYTNTNNAKLDSEDQKLALAYYNFLLGNAEYRANQPGLAALAYQRTLENSPNFYEAKQNLAFIQRKEGAIMPILNPQDEWLIMVPYHYLSPMLIVSSALFLVSLIAALSIPRKRALWILGTVLFGVLFGCTVLIYCFYPQVPASTPAKSLYIVTQACTARHAADSESPSLLSLPPSTPLKLLAASGSWCYIETFNKTRGWVNQKEIECVAPTHK